MGADAGIHVEVPEGAPLSRAAWCREGPPRDHREAEGARGSRPGDHGQAGDRRRRGADGPDPCGLDGLGAGDVREQGRRGRGENEANVTREIDGGLEELKCRLPLIVTTDLRCVKLIKRSDSLWN